MRNNAKNLSISAKNACASMAVLSCVPARELDHKGLGADPSASRASQVPLIAKSDLQ